MIHETLLAAKAALEDSTLYAKWKRDNPKEFARIEAYWVSGGTFPLTVNPFGLMYALVAKAYWESRPHVLLSPPAAAAASVPRPDGSDVRIAPLASRARASLGSIVVTYPDPYLLPFIPV